MSLDISIETKRIVKSFKKKNQAERKNLSAVALEKIYNNIHKTIDDDSDKKMVKIWKNAMKPYNGTLPKTCAHVRPKR